MIQKMPESEGRPARKGRAPSKTAAARIDRGADEETLPSEDLATADLPTDDRVTGDLPGGESREDDVTLTDEAPSEDEAPVVDGPEASEPTSGDEQGPEQAEAAAGSQAGLGEDGGDPEEDGGLAGSGQPLPRRLEAVLFASGQALSSARLSKVVGATIDEVNAALDGLVAEWAERDTALEITAIAGGYRFMTRAEFHPDLAGLARKGKVDKLSPAALETLAVVAYRQPISRAEIEAVRGVAAGPLLRVLLDRDLIRITGRSPEPGHPLLYGTTKRFLDHFGLKSLKSLPDIKDLLDVS